MTKEALEAYVAIRGDTWYADNYGSGSETRFVCYVDNACQNPGVELWRNDKKGWVFFACREHLNFPHSDPCSKLYDMS